MKNSEERDSFNLWILSMIITFIIAMIGFIFGNIVILFVSFISGIISSIIFISLMEKIVSAIEKLKERSYKELKEKSQLEDLKEEEHSDKDLLINNRYNTFMVKIDNAETIKELELMLEEMSISKVKLERDSGRAIELKNRIKSKYEELSNEKN